jgi:hypothetical protein
MQYLVLVLLDAIFSHRPAISSWPNLAGRQYPIMYGYISAPLIPVSVSNRTPGQPRDSACPYVHDARVFQPWARPRPPQPLRKMLPDRVGGQFAGRTRPPLPLPKEGSGLRGKRKKRMMDKVVWSLTGLAGPVSLSHYQCPGSGFC